jgi:hypothetical protein
MAITKYQTYLSHIRKNDKRLINNYINRRYLELFEQGMKQYGFSTIHSNERRYPVYIDLFIMYDYADKFKSLLKKTRVLESTINSIQFNKQMHINHAKMLFSDKIREPSFLSQVPDNLVQDIYPRRQYGAFEIPFTPITRLYDWEDVPNLLIASIFKYRPLTYKIFIKYVYGHIKDDANILLYVAERINDGKFSVNPKSMEVRKRRGKVKKCYDKYYVPQFWRLIKKYIGYY